MVKDRVLRPCPRVIPYEEDSIHRFINTLEHG